MYIRVMDRAGTRLAHRNIRSNDFACFLEQVEPYRHDLTVACECIFSRVERDGPPTVWLCGGNGAAAQWQLLVSVFAKATPGQVGFVMPASTRASVLLSDTHSP